MMKRPAWQAQLWALLLYPLAIIQALLLFRPDATGELFFLSFLCLLFGVLYALVGYMVRSKSA